MARTKLRQSFSYAIDGLSYAVRSGRNMKIHLLATFLVIILAYYFGFSRLEWAILMLTIFMVLAAETMNSAVEKTVDLVTRDYHPIAKIAKNLAAGSVLLTAINAVIIAILLFGPHL
ncbi:MAG: diacylglycerol kinase family protein [Bacillota bacterium]|nr:diacylglycerol kinase family protein [Bacillota bacterium]